MNKILKIGLFMQIPNLVIGGGLLFAWLVNNVELIEFFKGLGFALIVLFEIASIVLIAYGLAASTKKNKEYDEEKWNY